jgi:hypothetical protein
VERLILFIAEKLGGFDFVVGADLIDGLAGRAAPAK